VYESAAKGSTLQHPSWIDSSVDVGSFPADRPVNGKIEPTKVRDVFEKSAIDTESHDLCGATWS
jgi:hypothetical protein